MSQTLHPPAPVKLIVGMLSPDDDLLRRAEQAMADLWGPIDLRSETIDFDFTNYYEAEMGPNLLRRFVSFERLIDPLEIAQCKHQSNHLEQQYQQQAHAASGTALRPINLDPGYIDLAKLVLATTKDFSHRVYIGSNMYAETTLRFVSSQWTAWPFTYPDYASGRYFPFLVTVRQRLVEQRKEPA